MPICANPNRTWPLQLDVDRDAPDGASSTSVPDRDGVERPRRRPRLIAKEPSDKVARPALTAVIRGVLRRHEGLVGPDGSTVPQDADPASYLTDMEMYE